MSEPESSSSLSPGEIARIAAKDRLTAIENGPDTVAAGLATHFKHIILDGHNRICFIDSRNLADRIFMDPAYTDSKVYYWFLMNDSEASSDEELLEEYATLRGVMSEMGNPEDLSYEQFLSITNNGPTTHTSHFTLLVRCADRTFFSTLSASSPLISNQAFGSSPILTVLKLLSMTHAFTKWFLSHRSHLTNRNVLQTPPFGMTGDLSLPLGSYRVWIDYGLSSAYYQSMNSDLIIYQNESGAIELKGDFSHETIWATQFMRAYSFL
ncbi:MAG: hypothetical protein KatS3mg087_0406 [Patescibacteria group bacterium]|nr:MAG: hypothetical protein KatS3mg087_0406 [Patescibacteria group bacterium]